jgi:hypothetical protein
VSALAALGRCGMKFILVSEEDGGCDYTIGCGICVEEIEANSLKAAIEVVVSPDEYGERTNVDYWQADRDAAHSIVKSTLYVVSEVVDMAPFLDKAKAEDEAREQWAQEDDREASERAEFARLSKKYGGAK